MSQKPNYCYSDEVMRKMLPAGACKRCVRFFQCYIGEKPKPWYLPYPTCENCGISILDSWNKVNEVFGELKWTPKTGRPDKV
jgi:hypothetical protein